MLINLCYYFILYSIPDEKRYPLHNKPHHAIYKNHHDGKIDSKIVFGRDMLLHLKFVADWGAIKLRKQRDVDKNNSRENSSRIHHDYQVGDKVLITQVMAFIEN